MRPHDFDATEANHSSPKVVSFFERYFRREEQNIHRHVQETLAARHTTTGQSTQGSPVQCAVPAENLNDPVYKAVHRHVRKKKFKKYRRIRSKIIKRLVHRQSRLCFYCGCDLTLRAGRPNTATLDHWMPESRGGPSDEFNYVAACFTCNNLKGDMHPLDFLKLMQQKFIMALETAAFTKLLAEGGDPTTGFAATAAPDMAKAPPLFMYALTQLEAYTAMKEVFHLAHQAAPHPSKKGKGGRQPENAAPDSPPILPVHHDPCMCGTDHHHDEETSIKQQKYPELVHIETSVQGSPTEAFAVTLTPTPEGTRVSFIIPDGASKVQVSVARPPSPSPDKS